MALHAPSGSPLEGWSLILVDALPVGVSVETEVDFNLGYDGYFLSARINVSLPGIEHSAAKAMIKEAHEICRYSNATRGNIDEAINLI